ncbi:MAG: DUF167 domain-containing protein [Candidatus Omnitrophota bacterium]
MKITVKIKPGSSREKVEKAGEADYSVRVTARPVDGKANEAAIKALAGYFGVSRSKVTLVRGHTSKIKIFEIEC